MTVLFRGRLVAAQALRRPAELLGAVATHTALEPGVQNVPDAVAEHGGGKDHQGNQHAGGNGQQRVDEHKVPALVGNEVAPGGGAHIHALRNSMIPIITMIGGAVAGMIGGSVILETMFNMPGIGAQVVSALDSRDYPLVQGCVLVFSIFVMIVNLLVDLAYKWIDPRVELD